MSTQEGHEPIPNDPRSAEQRRTDQEVAALFRDSGLALSNGYQPELLGADARHRAAEEESIRAVFDSARHLQPGADPDFRQMAARARTLAKERAGSGQDDDLVGELTRSTLRQLPDLEVRCWHVSQTGAMVVEAAAPTAAVLSAPAVAAPPAAPAAAEPAAFTAHDMANIRENDWAEFKRRYHREGRRQVLQMAVAGVLGAAACFLVLWSNGQFAPAASHSTAPSSASGVNGGLPPGPLPLAALRGDEPRHDVRPVADRAEPGEDTLESVDPASWFGGPEYNWVQNNGSRFGVETADGVDPFLMPTIFSSRAEPNPARRLGQPAPGAAAQANGNVPPELYPEPAQGLRVIRLSPRSDFALASLSVNDWITRVIKPDGTEIDLSFGSAENMRQWQEYLSSLHGGDEFDVEYLRGRLIRRTTIALSGDSLPTVAP